MKKSLLSLALFALMVAGTAHADTTTNAPAPQDLTRFDVSCSFARPGLNCEAMSRIFLNRNRPANANPQWFGNLLSVACQQLTSPPSPLSLLSASDAQLIRQTDEHGDVSWEIFNSDSTVDIDLADHPFNPSGATVNATLEFDHASLTGSCTVVATAVHGLN